MCNTLDNDTQKVYLMCSILDNDTLKVYSMCNTLADVYDCFNNINEVQSMYTNTSIPRYDFNNFYVKYINWLAC